MFSVSLDSLLVYKIPFFRGFGQVSCSPVLPIPVWILSSLECVADDYNYDFNSSNWFIYFCCLHNHDWFPLLCYYWVAFMGVIISLLFLFVRELNFLGNKWSGAKIFWSPLKISLHSLQSLQSQEATMRNWSDILRIFYNLHFTINKVRSWEKNWK